jgi:hypothetical protein
MLDIVGLELRNELGVLEVCNESSAGIHMSRELRRSGVDDDRSGTAGSILNVDISSDAQRFEGTKMVRLDGSMSLQQRKWTLQKFSSDKSCRIMLISLRAGGVGLNLTDADCVILADAWWNPSVEDQAIDRVHRLGQMRQVRVYRLICTNSVESKMLLLQVVML